VISELWPYLIAVIIGAGLGAFYFGSLWLTLRGLPQRRRPALWLLVSFVSRLTVTLAVFYGLINATGPIALGIALASFMVVRIGLLRRLRPVSKKP
jgi:F1F0 ATPase subunit 2